MSRHGFAEYKTFADLSGEFEIISVKNGKPADVNGNDNKNGAVLQSWEFNGQANQRFRLHPKGESVYTITAVHSGKFLDVDGVSQANGARVHQWDENNGPNQQWYIEYVDGRVTHLRAIHSKKALDVAGGGSANGNPLQQWDFTEDNENQRFRILRAGAYRYAHEPTHEFRIRSLANGKFADVAGASQDNGAQLQSWEWLSGPNQKFRLQPVAGKDRVYNIIAVHSGKLVDINGVSNDNGAKGQQWANNGQANQQFFIEHINGVPTTIIAQHSKKAIDLSGGAQANGTWLNQWEFVPGNINQLFAFERV